MFKLPTTFHPVFMAILLLVSGCKQNPPAPYKNAIACAHEKATEAGSVIFKAGGNAIDAAVAVHFALAVVYPQAGNLGGGGFAVVHSAAGESITLDFRERAPLAAQPDMYLDSAGNVIPDRSTFTVHSAGIPGSVDGMWQLHQKYGSLPWKDILQPAIDLAEKGFEIDAFQADNLNRYSEQFEILNDSQYNYLGNRRWQSGDILVQQDLSKVLLAIQEWGPDGFYKGFCADSLVNFVQRKGGILNHRDLEEYDPVWRDPFTFSYQGYKVLTMPPPSSGGVVMAQVLGMKELLNYEAAPNSAQYIHFLSELEKMAYADRNMHLGDPDYWKNPIDSLVDERYLESKMRWFSAHQTIPSSSLGKDVPYYESTETTHISVLDEQGNAVSITTTINAAYGARIFVPGLGFLLNNEMDDFSAKPGVPNRYGLIGSEANAIAPGKRPLSSMTPTIVLDEKGQIKLVVGSPGGSTIITSVMQVILNYLHSDQSLQSAIDAPRFHHQWLPEKIKVEEALITQAISDSLVQVGHALDTVELLGKVNAVGISSNGTVETGADKRGKNHQWMDQD